MQQGSLVIDTPTAVLAITDPSSLPNCTISTNFSYTFNVTGGVQPYTWSLFSGALQPGLSLSSVGVLSGQCSNDSGTATFTIQVQDSAGNATTKTFQQTAQAAPPPTLTVLTSPAPVSPSVQQTYYFYNFNASGGIPAYSWTVTVGSIPTGLTLTSAGTLSGFPSTPATYNFTVQVTDTQPVSATAAFSIQILAAGSGPVTALEPQNWVDGNQGGNAAHPNLPATCNDANLCKKRQLGFGTNDYPATFAGLTSAGAEWVGLATNWYMQVEIAAGSLLNGATYNCNSNTALYCAPVKATPGTGYFVVQSSTPLQSRIPCNHGWSDADLISGAATRNPDCTNDLPSMYYFRADAINTSSGSSVVFQGGNNTVYKDYEVTMLPGINQSIGGPGSVCAGANCADSFRLWNRICAHCGSERFYAHGWDPEPNGSGSRGWDHQPAGACQMWALRGAGTPPAQYANGCGDDVQSAIKDNCSDCWMEHFLVNRCHWFNSEGHCVGGGDGTGLANGPSKIVDFWIEGGSQGFFVSGANITPSVGILTDVEMRRGRLTRDAGWRALTGSAGHSPGSPANGCNNFVGGNTCPFSWAIKNSFELKTADRLMCDGCIIEDTWPDGQVGYALLITPSVCSGGSACAVFDASNIPIIRTNNLRFTNSIIRNAASMTGDRARSGSTGNGGGQSQGENYILFKNDLVYGFDQTQWGGSLGAQWVDSGMGTSAAYTSCQATRTSGKAKLTCDPAVINPKPYNELDMLAGTVSVKFGGQQEDPFNGGVTTLGCDKIPGCLGTGTEGTEYGAMQAIGTDCTVLPCTVAAAGTYKPLCGGGIGDSDGFTLGAICSNCGVSGTSACPKLGCRDVACTLGTPFADAPNGGKLCSGTGSNVTTSPPGCGPANVTFATIAFQYLDISQGDIIRVYNCSDTSFNTPVQPVLTQPLAVTPTDPGSNSFYYTIGQAGLPDVSSGVICTTDNASGWQKNLIMQHTTIVSTNVGKMWARQKDYLGQMQNQAYYNNIFYFGPNGCGWCALNVGGEASSGGYKAWDQTTLQIHHNAFLLPTTARAAKYTAVGLSGSTICPSGTVPGNCVPPAVTCPSGTVTSTNGVPDCAGFQGYMSGTAFPSTDCQLFDITACPMQSPPGGSFDIHQLKLHSSNPMNTMATDGTMLGVDFAKLDAAQTRALYVCEGSCGSGPYTD